MTIRLEVSVDDLVAMESALRALRLHVPPSVANDVDARFRRLVGEVGVAAIREHRARDITEGDWRCRTCGAIFPYAETQRTDSVYGVRRHCPRPHCSGLAEPVG